MDQSTNKANLAVNTPLGTFSFSKVHGVICSTHLNKRQRLYIAVIKTSCIWMLRQGLWQSINSKWSLVCERAYNAHIQPLFPQHAQTSQKSTCVQQWVSRLFDRDILERRRGAAVPAGLGCNEQAMRIEATHYQHLGLQETGLTDAKVERYPGMTATCGRSTGRKKWGPRIDVTSRISNDNWFFFNTDLCNLTLKLVGLEFRPLREGPHWKVKKEKKKKRLLAGFGMLLTILLFSKPLKH